MCSKIISMLIDTHAHLYWDSYKEDLGQVLQRAQDSGVTTIINVGVDVELSKVAAEQETKEIRSYSSIAIHPEEAIKYRSDGNSIKKLAKDVEELEKIYLEHKEKIVAVGECGLDYGYFTKEGYLPKGMQRKEAKQLQIELFKLQIELAKKLNLPLLAHVRDDRSQNPYHIEAWDEVFTLVGNHPTIMHCYSGLMETTKKAAVLPNILISFAGNATYPKNENLKEAIKFLPLEKIVLETDSPFLPPQSIRGKRNEPSSVKEIAEFIAQIKGVSFEEVAKQTTENVERFLKLS